MDLHWRAVPGEGQFPCMPLHEVHGTRMDDSLPTHPPAGCRGWGKRVCVQDGEGCCIPMQLGQGMSDAPCPSTDGG